MPRSTEDWRDRLGAASDEPRPAPRGGAWTRGERAVLGKLSTPARIQDFVDRLAYRPEMPARCPRIVLEERRAHCYDGALLAAAALRRLGHPPLLLDLWAVRDDDHVLALYRQDGCWGAVAKSNFVGLRFREPIYRSYRELALSYFDPFYSLDGIKTLRFYTRPLNLAVYDRYNWMTSDEGARVIERRLTQLKLTPLLTPEMIANLTPIDKLSYDSMMTGANPDGIYVPGKKKK